MVTKRGDVIDVRHTLCDVAVQVVERVEILINKRLDLLGVNTETDLVGELLSEVDAVTEVFSTLATKVLRSSRTTSVMPSLVK